MARRKKNDSTAKLLLALPWQISVAFGGITFVMLQWVLPLTLKGNMFLPIVMQVDNMVTWFSVCFFGFLALASFSRSKSLAASKQKFEAPEFERAKTSHDERRATSAVNTATPDAPSRPTSWSLEALRSLEWKRFELLCAKYYEMVGFKAETIRCGPDGGIDVKLFKMDESKPIAIIQCKAWNASDVGVKEIRELLGVMTHEDVKRGIFITTGAYTKDAIAFGVTSPIQMLDGVAFFGKLVELTAPQQQALLSFAFEGDYRTPTCPSCGVKMVKRNSKRGEFYGCVGYPRCRRTFAM